MTTYYTKDHEWIKTDGDDAVVGITAFAAGKLGDVVFVELPDMGKTVGKGLAMAVVESVKAASDVYSPVGGEIIEANAAIVDEPGKVNEDPEGAGWFVKVRIYDEKDLAGLMDKAAYDAFCASQ